MIIHCKSLCFIIGFNYSYLEKIRNLNQKYFGNKNILYQQRNFMKTVGTKRVRPNKVEFF